MNRFYLVVLVGIGLYISQVHAQEKFPFVGVWTYGGHAYINYNGDVNVQFLDNGLCNLRDGDSGAGVLVRDYPYTMQGQQAVVFHRTKGITKGGAEWTNATYVISTTDGGKSLDVEVTRISEITSREFPPDHHHYHLHTKTAKD